VKDGMTFFLVDVSTGATLATATTKLTQALDVTCWGDSLTAGAYPMDLQPLLPGSTVYNLGVGGYTSEQIRARFLSFEHLYDFNVIWSGRNNYGDTEQVISDIADMVAALPSPKRFVVLSLPNGDFSAEYPGMGGYGLIQKLNDALRSTYPNNYIDVRSYLVSKYDPTDPQDVIDHEHDVTPSSLRADQLHLNAEGYGLVAQKIADFISAH
jgi:lysophospholipase L1-like esterase